MKVKRASLLLAGLVGLAILAEVVAMPPKPVTRNALFIKKKQCLMVAPAKKSPPMGLTESEYQAFLVKANQMFDGVDINRVDLIIRKAEKRR